MDVGYYFECVTEGDFNSPDWQSSSTYEANGFTKGIEYGFKVRARDTMPVIPDDGTGEPGNKTEWSVIRYAVAGEEEDHTPPEPDPMTWALPPAAVSNNAIIMTASTATDASGVEYGFWNLDTDVVVWQNDREFLDEGLDLLTEYTYRTAARDKSINENTTAWSAPASATTADEPTPSDFDPPETGVHTNIYKAAFSRTEFPEQPASGELNPVEVSLPDGYHHRMIAVEATDATEPVQYMFICVSDSRFSSGWQEDTAYDVLVAIRSRSSWIWQVVTRDSASPTPNVGDLSDYWNCRGQTYPYP